MKLKQYKSRIQFKNAMLNSKNTVKMDMTVNNIFVCYNIKFNQIVSEPSLVIFLTLKEINDRTKINILLFSFYQKPLICKF